MAALQLVAILASRVSLLGESIHRSQSNTDGMVSILSSFGDRRLSALEVATQVRRQAIRMAYDNIDKMLKAVEVILARFDVTQQADAKILRGPHQDLESYIKAMDQLRGVIQFFKSNQSFKMSDGVVKLCNNLLVKSILKLEEEFKQILATYSKPVEPDDLFDGLDDGGNNSSTSNGFENQSKTLEAAVNKPPTLIPPRILPLLRDLAEQLIHVGNQVQILKIYRDARASSLEQSLQKLGVNRFRKYNVQRMQSVVLEANIRNWIHFMRIAIKLLFAEERKICDQIFDIDSQRDQCFAEVTGNSVERLLSFGDAIARSKMPPEKLFMLLDMYEIMHELQPEIKIIFKGKACSKMRESALSLTKRLAQTAQKTIHDFEECVEETVRDFEARVKQGATEINIHDGAVHPLTECVINYVKPRFNHRTRLRQLFQELEFETGGNSNSQLAAATMSIMLALHSNLDGKSNPALTHLFLMNNFNYMVMVRSVLRSEAKDLLGNYWAQRHLIIGLQNANQYKSVAWSKILRGLDTVGLYSSRADGSGRSARETVKEMFKSFNIQFKKLDQIQSRWTIPDPELCETLRLAFAEVLLPPYRTFLGRFWPLVEIGVHPPKYIRYTQEDLDQMLGEFFEGNTWNESKRKEKKIMRWFHVL